MGNLFGESKKLFANYKIKFHFPNFLSAQTFFQENPSKKIISISKFTFRLNCSLHLLLLLFASPPQSNFHADKRPSPVTKSQQADIIVIHNAIILSLNLFLLFSLSNINMMMMMALGEIKYLSIMFMLCFPLSLDIDMLRREREDFYAIGRGGRKWITMEHKKKKKFVLFVIDFSPFSFVIILFAKVVVA